MNGWIMIHRKILDWEWYSNPCTFRLFVHLLLKANHEPKQWRGFTISAGQVVIGRRQLANDLGLSERNIRTSLTHLKSTGELTIKTTNKFSIVTICNWSSYQASSNSKRPTERPTKGQSNDHKQERREIKNNTHVVSTIITYLNKKANKNFKPTTANTIKLINGRLNEGYSIKDLKQVVDTKSLDWIGTVNEKYLRPETLFNASKFESYINQKSMISNQTTTPLKPLER